MKKKLYIETYGCQMNFSDSEIIASVMQHNDYELTKTMSEADVILVNTCAIRDNAEKRVLGRIQEFRKMKQNKPGTTIGVVGCMAERLKEDLLKTQKDVDLIAGPDSYRHLPEMLEGIREGQQMANVILSEEETYENIEPVRLDAKGISAFISIMRGCNNFCSYCVVPYTRGRERSRNPETILNEAKNLYDKGYREITLLGQNVNSYNFQEGEKYLDFPELLRQVAAVHKDLRIRFATSHPKDISDKLIQTIAETENIPNAIHLPVQSGSTNVLKRMNRKYTRDWYLNRIETIRKHIPDCGITTDIIAGFCGETEPDHQETLSLMKQVGYDFAFMFKYSERPGTLAEKRFDDDVPEDVKSRRLQEIIQLQQELSQQSNANDLNKTFTVLVEGPSKKDAKKMMGRNQQNKVIVFPASADIKGQYVQVKVTGYTSATLLGELIS
ncbi:MAG: tRNA (N6-isopentenyl adenosine(37)-C2)-methylthiotransferase MiaB [Bacteroidales bacterium]|nr:tRNA (N6-isopentenyl adenosine(37)-C2)-methylthiotransferase MiaB [Bacteroidales bacterium]MCF8326972.1 tRNA (N6-isopentenyl adenosine(37)-C2)-methylthiotransferase MiaB [Bacteroidales bacterium]